MVNACIGDHLKLEQKMAEMEVRTWRNNIRIIGLAEDCKKNDQVGFLPKNLLEWIPSLNNNLIIEIDRAHRIYGKGTTWTMIFRCLRYQDCQAILEKYRKMGQSGKLGDCYSLKPLIHHTAMPGICRGTERASHKENPKLSHLSCHPKSEPQR